MRRKSKHKILHFCCEQTVIALRNLCLSEAGYYVLNSSNGFETIRLVASGQVDAAVLDMGHNVAETTLIAKEIKRLRPQVPTVVITERTVPADPVYELADLLVANEDGPEVLVKTLNKLLVQSGHSGAVA